MALYSPAAQGATRTVPTDYPTISQALLAALPADTVLVLPGVYFENLLMTQDVVLRSAEGPTLTVVDGGSPSNPDSASVVTMIKGTVEGFDIRNGTGTVDPNSPDIRTGGGIEVNGFATPGASVVIRGNWVHGNTLTSRVGTGAGIRIVGTARIAANRIFDNRILGQESSSEAGVHLGALDEESSAIEGNEIYGNQVVGGSAAAVGPGGTIRNNVIACNSATGSPFSGAAVYCRPSDTLEANTIVGNWSDNGRPIVYVNNQQRPSVALLGNNIAYNIGPAVECEETYPGEFVFGCNNFYRNAGGEVVGDCGPVVGQNGNIAAEPEFGRGSCPSQPGDWCLAPGSPLLPENGPPGCGLIGARGACPPIAVPEAEASPPRRFQGLRVSPSPFAERTGIEFHLAREDEVAVEIYGVLGRKVRTLEAGWLAAGDHHLEWNGRGDDGVRAASGAYVAVIRAGSEEVTQVLLIVR